MWSVAEIQMIHAHVQINNMGNFIYFSKDYLFSSDWIKQACFLNRPRVLLRETAKLLKFKPGKPSNKT